MSTIRPRLAAAPLRRLLVALLALAFVSACADGGSPTSPTPPTPFAAAGTVGTNLVITEGAHIDVEKATNGDDADEAPGPRIPVGERVTWTYTVTNTGSQVLNGIVVTDDKVGVIECPRTTLPSGEQMTCTATALAEEGQYRNVATAMAANPERPDIVDRDPSHYFGVTREGPRIDLEKATNGVDADEATGPRIVVGDAVVWTYVVTNVGGVSLFGIVVRDDMLGVVECPAASLAPGETMTCTARGVAREGQYRNVGTVVGSPPEGDSVSDRDPSHYIGVPGDDPAPRIDIEKSTNGLDADLPTGPVVNVGDPVRWTYMVTNVGNVPLFGIAVTDDRIGAIACPAVRLAVGESMTCTATGTAIAGQYRNVATVVGTALEIIQVRDSDPSHYFGIEDTPGFLGCSHGYWKNHLGEWAQTPFAPSDLVADYFVSTAPYPAIANSTLLEALEFPGGSGVEGGIRILMRQAVGALLNAAHPGVSGPYTVSEIISTTDAAIGTADRQTILALSGDLDRANNLGCPLN